MNTERKNLKKGERLSEKYFWESMTFCGAMVVGATIGYSLDYVNTMKSGVIGGGLGFGIARLVKKIDKERGRESLLELLREEPPEECMIRGAAAYSAGLFVGQALRDLAFGCLYGKEYFS